MSNNNFVKGACRQCGGHLEFPAAAAGETIACPHCGQPTELGEIISPNKTRASRLIWLGIGLLLFVVAAGLAAALLWTKKAGHDEFAGPPTNSVVRSNAPNLSASSAAVATNPPDEQRTNDFAISPVKLETTPGSSLVYVTGTVRNVSSRQRFGVKVAFGLFDANTNAVGEATDYESVMEPNGDWRFKALVMKSKVASARLNSIAEDQR
jgi:hypothetical protein